MEAADKENARHDVEWVVADVHRAFSSEEEVVDVAKPGEDRPRRWGACLIPASHSAQGAITQAPVQSAVRLVCPLPATSNSRERYLLNR